MKRSTILLILAIEVMLMPLVLWAGDDGPPDDRPRARHRQPLDEAETNRILEFVKENWPEYHTRLLQIRKDNPRRFQMMMRAAAHRMKQFEALSQEERELHIRDSKLKIEVYRLAKQYRNVKEDDKKAAIRKELQDIVAESFDVEQKMREYGLQHLESQIKQLRKELANRAERRDEIIAERVEDIINSKDGHFDDRKNRGDGPPDGPPPADAGDHGDNPPPPPGETDKASTPAAEENAEK